MHLERKYSSLYTSFFPIELSNTRHHKHASVQDHLCMVYRCILPVAVIFSKIKLINNYSIVCLFFFFFLSLKHSTIFLPAHTSLVTSAQISTSLDTYYCHRICIGMFFVCLLVFALILFFFFLQMTDKRETS